MFNLMITMGKSCSCLAILAGAAGALSGCERERLPDGVRERHAPASASAPAPSVDSAAATGAGPFERVTAESLRSAIRSSGKKATLVNAWASWCGPCRRELPMLSALAQKLKPRGVQIVLVSVDDPKDEPKAAAFLKDNAITLEGYVVDGSIADFKAGINPRWPGMLPASFLFGPRAELVHFWGGEAFEDEISSVVDAFLAGRPIEAETRFGLAPGKVEP